MMTAEGTLSAESEEGEQGPLATALPGREAARRVTWGRRGRMLPIMKPRPSRWSLLLVLGALAVGCAHSGAVQTSRFGRDDWERALRRAGVKDEQVSYPFETTPEIDGWVRATLRTELGESVVQQLRALQDALFRTDFRFTYEEDLTLPASEAFRQRRGNCMSFTALFVTMARSAGIPAFLMAVRRTPEVDREEDLVVVNRHVVAGYQNGNQVHLFDFYIRSSAPFVHEFVIDDVLASAMYENNLGGAAIRHGDLSTAVRHLEIATALAPRWAAGWVNLGVARFRAEDTNGAIAAYERALRVEPNDPSALVNLAHVYRYLGLAEQADAALEAAAHRTTNPFTLIAMADAELTRENLSSAGRYLRKARRWYGDEPAVWEAMARLARHRGDPETARRHEARAERLRAKSAPGDDATS